MTRPPTPKPTLLIAGLIAAGLSLSAPVPRTASAADATASPTPEAGAIAEPSRQALAFEHFIRRSGPLCQSEASTRCVGEGWRFADGNGDGEVAMEELRALRAALLDWTQWRGDSLPASERLGINGGVWLIDTVGLEALFASYDVDGDASLSLDELLADVSLDQRPLGAVLLDPEAVDRQAVSARLGKFSPMLEALLRPH